MPNPLVSICIPTYKQTDYLQKCLQSVLTQDFKDYELIISDDTPDDSIEQFIKPILNGTKYKYYRNNPALGSPQNWNHAISKATGKYIKLLHHDDVFTQVDSLSLMVEKMEKEQSVFLFCQTDVWYTKSDLHRIQSVSPKQLELIKKQPEFLFFKNVIGAPSAVMHINNPSIQYDVNLKWLVDVDFYIQQLKQCKCSFIAQPLVSTAHDVEGQITGSVQDDKNIQIKEHVLLFNKLKANRKAFADFFDYLFLQYHVSSFKELISIVPEASVNASFFEAVIKGLPLNRKWKAFKKRFFESRYNNYMFKLEQFK